MKHTDYYGDKPGFTPRPDLKPSQGNGNIRRFIADVSGAVLLFGFMFGAPWVYFWLTGQFLQF